MSMFTAQLQSYPSPISDIFSDQLLLVFLFVALYVQNEFGDGIG
jgi:hypothetical protein